MLLRISYAAKTIFLILIPLFFIAGCSSGIKSPVSLDTADEKLSHKDNTILSLGDFPIDEMDSTENSRQLLGTWQMNFNPQSHELTLTPNRDLSAHYYINNLVDVEFDNITYDPQTGALDVDATIINPFSFAGYDVRMIVYTNDCGSCLLNADDWTKLHDIPGGGQMNPFKAFAKDQQDRIFSASAQHTESLELVFPPGCPSAIFEIEASYPDNCEEPYMIDNFQHGTLYSNQGASTTAEVDVYDWQNDVNSVSLWCPEITGQTWVSFTNANPNTWELNLVNETGTSQGNYVGHLRATSGAAELYDVIEITITQQPPDYTPPEWDTTTGITHAIPGDSYVLVRWGSATDPDNPPVEYLLYMDDLDNNVWDNDPLVIDENDPQYQSRQYMYAGLNNGNTYYFGVRCRDSYDPPNTDTNTIVLDATPETGTAPIYTLNFVAKPPADTWWDVCVQADSYVYVCADHDATDNVDGNCDTGLRTALKFDNDLTNMTVMNETDGMSAPSPSAWDWLTDWQRLDVSVGGNIVTSQCSAGIGTWSVAGSTATSEACCWAYSCGVSSPVPDVADHFSAMDGAGMVGFGKTDSSCTTEENWSLGFSDKDLSIYSGYNTSGYNDYPPTDFLTNMVGLEGIDNTDNLMIFYSSPTEGKISIWGDAYSQDGNATELDFTGTVGTGPGEFTGGLDLSIDSLGNIVTIEDNGGIFRFQKFASDLTFIYEHIWDGADAPMRIDFDKGDNTLYMLTDEGVHILNVN